MAKNIAWEARLIKEWLAENHPNSLQIVRPRLGPIPGKAPDKYKGVKRGWIDVVLKEGNTIYLIEAKMKPTAGACGQLKEYERLWPLTTEFSEWHNLPLRLVFLTVLREQVIEETCRDFGISYEVFAPQWALDYLKNLAIKGR